MIAHDKAHERAHQDFTETEAKILSFISREEELKDEDGTIRKVTRFVYTPHSIRATTATLLLDSGVDIIKVRDLLGHRHVTTTQIYDKRRRSLKEGASHDVPI